MNNDNLLKFADYFDLTTKPCDPSAAKIYHLLDLLVALPRYGATEEFTGGTWGPDDTIYCGSGAFRCCTAESRTPNGSSSRRLATTR